MKTLLQRVGKAHCLHKTMVWVRPCVNNWPTEFDLKTYQIESSVLLSSVISNKNPPMKSGNKTKF